MIDVQTSICFVHVQQHSCSRFIIKYTATNDVCTLRLEQNDVSSGGGASMTVQHVLTAAPTTLSFFGAWLGRMMSSDCEHAVEGTWSATIVKERVAHTAIYWPHLHYIMIISECELRLYMHHQFALVVSMHTLWWKTHFITTDAVKLH